MVGTLAERGSIANGWRGFKNPNRDLRREVFERVVDTRIWHLESQVVHAEEPDGAMHIAGS